MKHNQKEEADVPILTGVLYHLVPLSLRNQNRTLSRTPGPGLVRTTPVDRGRDVEQTDTHGPPGRGGVPTDVQSRWNMGRLTDSVRVCPHTSPFPTTLLGEGKW